MSRRPYDLVVFGATSFVGEILCRYLAGRLGFDGEVKWAIAGRSAARLEQLRSQLGRDAALLPVFIANADDPASLDQLCGSARVVVSTVGPYALYGENLVRACVDAGTDYCDLTGEVQWIKRMIDRYESRAKMTGARIVHCCGFDSIPSDMGVHFLQGEAIRTGGAPCTRIRMGVKAASGGFSGGTVASLLNVVKEALTDASLRADLADPYLICPSQQRPTVTQPDVRLPEFDAKAGSWMAPFVMSGINTRVVHRSHALSGHAWGRDFRYDEATMTGAGVKGRVFATAVSVGLGAFMAAVALPPSRWILEQWVLPKPGEGPSVAAQENGFFDLRFFGWRADGSQITVKVTGDRDPGYGSTAKMLGESALCLAFDVPRDSRPGGFWTPSTAMGESLRQRLVTYAGLGFSVIG